MGVSVFESAGRQSILLSIEIGSAGQGSVSMSIRFWRGATIIFIEYRIRMAQGEALEQGHGV